MVEGIILMILIAGVLITVVSKMHPIIRRSLQRRIKWIAIPSFLGIQIDEAKPMVSELNNTFKTAYQQNLKQRFLMEHTKWSEYKFDWTLFELKRYFLMNKLLKSVPMFSKTVDEVWHEFLMFTREYERFSKEYFKDMLHHVPNMESKPIPGERGFFDWVYLSLFESTPVSRTLWGGFLKYPIKREILEDFKNMSEEALLDKYFRNDGDWNEIKIYLINKLKNEIVEAERSDHHVMTLSDTSSESRAYQLATVPAVYYSLNMETQFKGNMDKIMPKQYYKKSAKGSSSSCSGYACSSYFDNDSGGNAGCDSGGSSCSSCGAGCSS